MNKKLLSLVSVLFLMSVLTVSCSNADKTGSGDNNSGSTTPQGIAKYEGTWQLTDAELTTILTISNSGAVTYIDKTSTNVANKGNKTYEVKFEDKDKPAGPGGILTLTLTFNDDNTSGTFINSDGPKGNMTKNNKYFN